jgi:hypothetical protein
MRKLAREAVIFTLLAAAVAGIAVFIITIANPPWWSTAPSSFSDSIVGSIGAAGFFGAPAGLSLWLLYRLIRFAVKG